MSTSTTPTIPCALRVHYRDIDGEARTMSGYLHGNQRSGTVALVINPAAVDIPSACCWAMPFDRVTRIEVCEPAAPAGDDNLAAHITPRHQDVLTRREQAIFDALVEHGGPIEWSEVPWLVPHLGYEHYQVNDALQGLVGKGRIVLAKSAGMASGVLTVTAP